MLAPLFSRLGDLANASVLEGFCCCCNPHPPSPPPPPPPFFFACDWNQSPLSLPHHAKKNDCHRLMTFNMPASPAVVSGGGRGSAVIHNCFKIVWSPGSSCQRVCRGSEYVNVQIGSSPPQSSFIPHQSGLPNTSGVFSLYPVIYYIRTNYPGRPLCLFLGSLVQPTGPQRWNLIVNITG